MYVMIKSTLRFDDVEVIPGLLTLLQAVQRSHMQSGEQSGRQPGNEARHMMQWHMWQKNALKGNDTCRRQNQRATNETRKEGLKFMLT